jgi:plasmid stabilization system protein ParE
MSKHFRIIWIESASRNLEEIASFISEDSPANAKNVLSRIKEKAETLRTLSERDRYLPELLDFGIRTWRELVIDRYRLVYRIEGKSVFVNAVLDGRRDLRDVLLNRLVR